jgi:hypothetical protein
VGTGGGTRIAGEVGGRRTGVPTCALLGTGRDTDARGVARLVGTGVGRLEGGGIGEGTSLTGAGGVAGDSSRWTGRSSPQVTAAMTAIAAAAASTRGQVRARAGRTADRPRSMSSASGTMPSAARR